MYVTRAIVHHKFYGINRDPWLPFEYIFIQVERDLFAWWNKKGMKRCTEQGLSIFYVNIIYMYMSLYIFLFLLFPSSHTPIYWPRVHVVWTLWVVLQTTLKIFFIFS